MSFDVLIGRPDVAEERISEPEDIAVKTSEPPPSPNLKSTEKMEKRIEYPRTMRKPECNTPIMGEPGGGERNRRNI